MSMGAEIENRYGASPGKITIEASDFRQVSIRISAGYHKVSEAYIILTERDALRELISVLKSRLELWDRE